MGHKLADGMERKRKRFRWLRRLLKRFRYRRLQHEDGKIADSKKDVEKWQEKQPLMKADYLAHRWRVLTSKGRSSTKSKKGNGPSPAEVPHDPASKVDKRELKDSKCCTLEDRDKELGTIESRIEQLKLDRVDKGPMVQMEDGSKKPIVIYRSITEPKLQPEPEPVSPIPHDHIQDNDKNHMAILETKVDKKSKKKKKKKNKNNMRGGNQKSCKYYSMLEDDPNDEDVDEVFDSDQPQVHSSNKKKRNRVVSVVLSRGSTRNSMKHVSAGLSWAARALVSSNEPCISQHGTYYGRYVPRYYLNRRSRLPQYNCR